MRSRPSRPPLPRRVAAGMTAAALLVLPACGEDDSDGRARDDASPSATPTSAATTGESSTSPTAGSYPAFTAEDYTYRLEVLCYCPQVGAVRVRVEDGEVVAARTVQAGRGTRKGADAPDYTRKTINDIIELANDRSVASADVTWPDGQDYPSSVAIDRLADATDDEVTYTIRNVRIR